MTELSMSVSHGDVGDPRHNLIEDYRKSLANVDPERTKYNVVLVDRSLDDVYKELFADSLAAYNAVQVAKHRPGRQIVNYQAHILESRQEHVEYEMVVQLGNRDTNSAEVAENRDGSTDVYREFLEEFQKKYPNLRVRQAVVHNDEATPHLHIKYVAFSTGNARGLETKNSLRGALKQMGYDRMRDINADFMALLEKVAKHYGIDRLEMGCNRPRLTVQEFKRAMERDENLNYRNDPNLVSAVMEQQHVIDGQARVIADYEKALGEVADARRASTARAAARGALERNGGAVARLRESAARLREIVAAVKSRVNDFIANPIPHRLTRDGEQDRARMPERKPPTVVDAHAADAELLRGSQQPPREQSRGRHVR